MSEKDQPEFTYEEMQKALALHIWKNDHLRDEIVKNPKATIERELNVQFDDNIKVNVVNHSDTNEVTFILPYNIHKAAGQQLSEGQLEEVAGGLGGNLGGKIKDGWNNYAPTIGRILKENAPALCDVGGSLIQAGAKSAFGVSLPTIGGGKAVGNIIKNA